VSGTTQGIRCLHLLELITANPADFVRTKNYDALAGVLLALTGCEAMFAKYVVYRHLGGSVSTNPIHHSLGQFNAASIRLSFVVLVYPCLMLAYLGQGAKLISNGEVVIANPFYLSIPGGSNGGLWWVTWVMGVFATVRPAPPRGDYCRPSRVCPLTPKPAR
jgi:KUP system potassium uptake protein